MIQLLCHLIGYYVLQSDFILKNKSKKTWVCLWHSVLYTLPFFLIITTNHRPIIAIFIISFVLNRFDLVKYFIYARNIVLNPKFYNLDKKQGYPTFDYCNTTGFYDDSPNNDRPQDCCPISEFGKPMKYFISFWLFTIIDCTFHLICNYLILKYLI